MIVKEVVKGSIADEIGIKANDIIISINGNNISDIIDYWFKISEESVCLEILSDSEVWEADIEKSTTEDLGIVFSDDVEKIKNCKNNCVFCFVNQLPKGMRHSLYIKDDDFRLSFLSGSYITLTNLNDKDYKRIVEQKISPLYVSIHTVDDELRKDLLNFQYTGKIIDKLKYLTDAGIKINTQIVLCPGINDGDKLIESIEKLSELYPGIQSLAVVPVGLTKHRENCKILSPVRQNDANDILDIINTYQKKFLQKIGTRFVWGSDELYIKANRNIADASFYEDFVQLENGVGTVAKFIAETNEALDKTGVKKSSKQKIAVATGVDFYPFMRQISDKIEQKLKCRINVYQVKNHFFGEDVTVTGLLTGSDLIKSLKGKVDEDILLLSQTCFKDNEELLLDNITREELSNELNIKCDIVKNTGYDFINKIIEYS